MGKGSGQGLAGGRAAAAWGAQGPGGGGRGSPRALAAHGRGGGGGRMRPVCVGTGLVVLDAIYDGRGRAGGSAEPRFFAGGSCGNVLTILSYLGWDSRPAAVVGCDPEGRRLVQDMERWGVGTDLVRFDDGSPTPRMIERVRSDAEPRHKFEMACGHGRRLPRRRPYPRDAALEAVARLPAPAKVFYFDRATDAALGLAGSLKARGALVVFEPHQFSRSGTFGECLAEADIVKYAKGGSPGGGRAAPRAALEVRTDGDRGLDYWLAGNGGGGGAARRARAPLHLGVIPAGSVVDEAGSGDWLTAGLVHLLCSDGGAAAGPPALARDAVVRALRFGQALSSLNCGHVGARGIMYAAAAARRSLVSAALRAAGLSGSAAAAGSALPARRGRRPRGTGTRPHSDYRAGRAPECSVCACSGGGR